MKDNCCIRNISCFRDYTGMKLNRHNIRTENKFVHHTVLSHVGLESITLRVVERGAATA